MSGHYVSQNDHLVILRLVHSGGKSGTHQRTFSLDLTVERRHYGLSALLAGPSYGLFISPFLRRRWWVFHSAIIAHDDAVFGNGDRVASPDAVGAVGAEKYFFFSSQT